MQTISDYPRRVGCRRWCGALRAVSGNAGRIYMCGWAEEEIDFMAVGIKDWQRGIARLIGRARRLRGEEAQFWDRKVERDECVR